MVMTDEIDFPDVPPDYPNSGADDLWFRAIWGDKKIMCLISYDVVGGPTCNTPECAKQAFEEKKHRIHKAAEALILAGKASPKDKALELRITRI
jgi:hypothetical protein